MEPMDSSTTDAFMVLVFLGVLITGIFALGKVLHEETKDDDDDDLRRG